MSQFLLLLISFLLSAKAFCYDYALDQNARESISVPVDGEKHFQRVISLSKKVNSVAELLKILPKNLKTNYVFMFESHSLQQASYQNPRAILFTDQADFIMTFNGSPSQEGYETLETIRYVETNNNPRFILEEIVMKTDESLRREFLQQNNKKAEIQFLLDRTDRLGQNPTACLTCHRQDPRPNWEHYPFWPGSYGQFDSKPYAQSALGLSSSNDEYVSAETYNSEAAKQFPLFLKNALTHVRYQHLEDIKNYGLLAPSMISYPDGLKPSPRTSEYRMAKVPLFHLTDKLAILNSRRIARIIRDSSSPRTNALKFFEIVNYCHNPYVLKKSKYVEAAEELYKNTDLPWEDFFMNFFPSPFNGFENSSNRSDLYMNTTLLEWFPNVFSEYIDSNGFPKKCLELSFKELSELN